jgi:hypothetical protein
MKRKPVFYSMLVSVIAIVLFIMAGRRPVVAGPGASEEAPGSLAALDVSGRSLGSCPIVHTEVQAEISGKVIGRSITPLPVIATVSRRQQLNGVDAEVCEILRPNICEVEPIEIGEFSGSIDKSCHICKAADAYIARAHVADDGPCCGQFIQDQLIV